MSERGFGGFVADVERLFTPRAGQRLVRPRHPRMIAGVCSGIAEYFGWNVTVLRLVVVVLMLPSVGSLVVGYAIGWVVIPEGTYALPGESGR